MKLWASGGQDLGIPNLYTWVFPKMVVHPFHTPTWSFFSRKTHGFVGETHHFRKHPYVCSITTYISGWWLKWKILPWSNLTCAYFSNGRFNHQPYMYIHICMMYQWFVYKTHGFMSHSQGSLVHSSTFSVIMCLPLWPGPDAADFNPQRWMEMEVVSFQRFVDHVILAPQKD